MLVLGAGPGGYSAAFRAADLGMKTVLVERYATLGGVCLNVGCIPSKALLHTAVGDGRSRSAGRPRHHASARRRSTSTSCAASRTGVVKKLTGGLAGMAKARKVEVVRGVGRFLDPHHLEVESRRARPGQDRRKKIVRFEKAIIAAGSQAVKLPFMPEDPRIVDSTGALLAASRSRSACW